MILRRHRQRNAVPPEDHPGRRGPQEGRGAEQGPLRGRHPRPAAAARAHERAQGLQRRRPPQGRRRLPHHQHRQAVPQHGHVRAGDGSRRHRAAEEVEDRHVREERRYLFEVSEESCYHLSGVYTVYYLAI